MSKRATGLFRYHRESVRGTIQVTNSDNRLRLVSDSEAQLRSIIATLEENRAALVESSNLEAAEILAVAILQLRMRLHGIDGSELKAFCQAVQLHEADRARKAAELTAKDRSVTKRGSRWPSLVS